MSNEIYTNVEEVLADLIDIDRSSLTEGDSLSIDVLEIKVKTMMEDYYSLLTYFDENDFEE